MGNKAMEALRTGKVMRYHAQPDVPCQSNAEHMWGVAILMLKFYPDCDKDMLAAALTHDCGEADVGDIPSPTKNKVPQIRKLIKELEHEALDKLGLNYEGSLIQHEVAALKICDVLEGLHYTAKHYHMTGGVEGGLTLQAWIDLANKLPLNDAQKDFVHECVRNPGFVKVFL